MNEYLAGDGKRLSGLLGLALRAASLRLTSGLAAWTIRKNVADMARRFIIGIDVRQALPALRRLHAEGIGFTADLLGEATTSEAEADAFQRRYLGLIDALATQVEGWPIDDVLDRNHLGPIPRANVSIKISALDSQLEAADPAGGARRLRERVRPLLLQARRRGVFVNFDMEQWELHEIIFTLFEDLLSDPELRDWPHVGIAIQAYLKAAPAQLERLLALARGRGAPLTVRLVKGAYWDSEVVRSRQFGYSCPVLAEKAATDLQFEALSLFLLDHIEHFQPAFGSHNLRSLLHALAAARERNLPQNAIELQMLYGMAEPERMALRQLGWRMRAYTPIGELLPGMAYFVRRLLENTSNSGFLRLSHHDGPRSARDVGAARPASRRRGRNRAARSRKRIASRRSYI